jgi:hypothetical protein
MIWEPLQLLYWKLQDWLVRSQRGEQPERGVIRDDNYSLITFSTPSKWTQYRTVLLPPSCMYVDPFTKGSLFVGSSINAMFSVGSYDLIINATMEVPQFDYLTHFLRVPVRDVKGANLFFNASHGLQVTLTLHQAIVEGKRVLVHCQFGASRSVAVTLAYLLWRHRQKSMLTVYEELRQKREIVHVNSIFLKEVKCLLSVWDVYTHALTVYNP